MEHVGGRSFLEKYIIWGRIWWLLVLIHFLLSLSVLCIVINADQPASSPCHRSFPACCHACCKLMNSIQEPQAKWVACSLFLFRIIIYRSNTLVNNSYDVDQAHVTNTVISYSPKKSKIYIWKISKGNTFLKGNKDVQIHFTKKH